MFRPLQLFADVACPALQDKQQCVLPRCLFSHAVPVPAPPSPAPKAPPKAPPTRTSSSQAPSSQAPPSQLPTPAPLRAHVSQIPTTNAPTTNAPTSHAPAHAPTPNEPPASRSAAKKKNRELKEVDRRLKAIVEGTSRAQAAQAAQAEAKAQVQARIQTLKQAQAQHTQTQTQPAIILDDSDLEITDRPDADTGAVTDDGADRAKRRKLSSDDGGFGGVSLEGYSEPKKEKKREKPKKPEPWPKPLPASTAPALMTAANKLKSNPPLVGRPVRTATAPKKAPVTDTAPKKTPTTATDTAPQLLHPRPMAREPAQLALHKELTRLHNNPADFATKQSVIRKTLDTEESTGIEKRAIYGSVMGRIIMRYMKLSPSDYATELAAERAAAERTAAATATAASSNRGLDNTAPPLKTGLSPAEELLRLPSLLHPPAVLLAAGYTLTPPSTAEIAAARAGLDAGSGWEACDRCTQRFQSFPGRRESDGALASGGRCTYHPGRSRRRAGLTSEPQWSCCHRPTGAANGCVSSSHHVFRHKDPKTLAASFPFIATPDNPAVEAAGPRAVALDCEMGYTTLGMELLRVTATAFPSGERVLDALVRPLGEVVDFNTQFSGVAADMMAAAPTFSPTPYPPLSTPLLNPTTPPSTAPLPLLPSPAAARAALCALITPTTPLIGHALENDLLALRLCHRAVIDTALLFPHVRGPPLRNKLKWIVEVRLRREIQREGDVAGHDSAVDARCAGEAVRFVIRGGREREMSRETVRALEMHMKDDLVDQGWMRIVGYFCLALFWVDFENEFGFYR
ncbi:hypothetical protein EDC01DRAFT_722207 [Geopyxis carbonaria]|nr:hypothetical protein EDC01DRAFT_722207 [Geopyxis carbonaria]